MKKVISCVLLLVMLLSFTLTAVADDVDFVSSIANKGAPDLVEFTAESGEVAVGYVRDQNDQIVEVITADEVMITAVGEAETSGDISAEAKEVLLRVYEELCEPGASLAKLCAALNDDVAAALGAGNNADNLVVKDLFDLTLLGDAAAAMTEDRYAELTFDISLPKDSYVAAMVYANDGWLASSIVNNGDGTVTCKLDATGPVAFMVPGATSGADTGDESGASLIFWGCTMAVSLAAIVVLAVVIYRRKKSM